MYPGEQVNYHHGQILNNAQTSHSNWNYHNNTNIDYSQQNYSSTQVRDFHMQQSNQRLNFVWLFSQTFYLNYVLFEKHCKTTFWGRDKFCSFFINQNV